MEFLGKLTTTESTFDKTQRVVTSEKLGIVVKLNINDFETNEQCEQFALLISKTLEMLEMLKLFTDFPDEDFKEDESNDYYTLSIKVSDMIKTKQLIKEATEL